MTYSLLEFAKESAEDMVTLPDQAETECLANTTKAATQPPPKRKEVLTKQAKRKLAGRTSKPLTACPPTPVLPHECPSFSRCTG